MVYFRCLYCFHPFQQSVICSNFRTKQIVDVTVMTKSVTGKIMHYGFPVTFVVKSSISGDHSYDYLSFIPMKNIQTESGNRLITQVTFSNFETNITSTFINTTPLKSTSKSILDRLLLPHEDSRTKIAFLLNEVAGYIDSKIDPEEAFMHFLLGHLLASGHVKSTFIFYH